MDAPNAFVGKSEIPTAADICAALGSSAKPWNEFVQWIEAKHGVAIQEWKSYSPKFGWSLRLKLKKRNIVYLSPCHNCFRVAFIFGDRAVKAALHSALPKRIINTIKGAPRYPEGTGIRLIVKSPSHLPAIRKLAEIKLAN
jgi:hypothetical protein